MSNEVAIVVLGFPLATSIAATSVVQKRRWRHRHRSRPGYLHEQRERSDPAARRGGAGRE